MSPIVFGLVAALCWGVLDFAGRFASRQISETTTVFWLTVTGLLGLSSVLAWRVGSGGALPIPAFEHLWLLALMGGGLALATFWLFAALARAPITFVSPIVASYPVTALLIAVAFGARPSLLQWAAMMAVIAGVVLVAMWADVDVDGTDNGWTAPVGTVLMYAGLAHLTFALAISAGQIAAPLYGEIEATWLARFFGLAVMLAVVMWRARRDGLASAAALPLRWVPLLCVMGLLDVGGLATLSAAGHIPGAEIATVVGSTFGVVTILLAWVILKEKINLVQWLGVAMVFGGGAVLAA